MRILGSNVCFRKTDICFTVFPATMLFWNFILAMRQTHRFAVSFVPVVLWLPVLVFFAFYTMVSITVPFLLSVR